MYVMFKNVDIKYKPTEYVAINNEYAVIFNHICLTI